MQQIWHLLLDEEFVRAYVHGLLIKCGDGVTRRLFPRIPQYSADYPEKWVPPSWSDCGDMNSLNISDALSLVSSILLVSRVQHVSYPRMTLTRWAR